MTCNPVQIESQHIYLDSVKPFVGKNLIKVLTGTKNYLSKIEVIWLEVFKLELHRSQLFIFDIRRFMNDNSFFLAKSEIQNNVGYQLYIKRDYFKGISLFKRQFHFISKNKL